MQIECFSLGKRFASPEENEDAVVILPGRGYAVIDGVTDRSGRRFGAMRAGRFASSLVATAVTRFLLAEDLSVRGGPERVGRLVQAIGEALRGAILRTAFWTRPLPIPPPGSAARWRLAIVTARHCNWSRSAIPASG